MGILAFHSEYPMDVIPFALGISGLMACLKFVDHYNRWRAENEAVL